tara:strand:+ start:947 stop:1528 length:582 start_codon:yes stop_codon:yes gene_type:complete
MNIALPVLLLIFGSLSLWLLTESHLKWYFKAACIATFCLFTGIFWSTIHSYLGWPANEDDMPEVVQIHWVVIKEPNKNINSKGGIYVLVESTKDETSSVLKVFGYKSPANEPRLFGLKYSRELHEKLMQDVVPKLKAGQPVVGKLTKEKAGNSKKGSHNKGKNDGKGDGSESQEQDWHFHELQPSDFLRKPTD